MGSPSLRKAKLNTGVDSDISWRAQGENGHDVLCSVLGVLLGPMMAGSYCHGLQVLGPKCMNSTKAEQEDHRNLTLLGRLHRKNIV